MHYLMLALHLWLAIAMLACQRDQSSKSRAPTPAPPTSEYCGPYSESLAILIQDFGDRRDLWARMLDHKDRFTGLDTAAKRALLDCSQEHP